MSIIKSTSITAALTILAATALPAEAILNYNIYETNLGVTVETEGSLVLPEPINGFAIWCTGGALESLPATICTGPQNTYFPAYAITGPTSIAGIAALYPSPDVSGISTILTSSYMVLGMDPKYVEGTPIVSSVFFKTKTLAELRLPSSGHLGTWILTGTGDTIHMQVVPGPLPLLGAGAAFASSRRLRRRLRLGRPHGENRVAAGDKRSTCWWRGGGLHCGRWTRS